MADEKDYYDAGNLTGDIRKIKNEQISYKKDLAKLSRQLSDIDRSVAELISIGKNMSRLNFNDAKDERDTKHRFKDTQDKWRFERETKKSSFSTKSDNGDKAVDDVWDALKDAIGLDKVRAKSSTGSKLGKYLDKFEDEFIHKMFNIKGFKSRINESLERYAEELGVTVDDIPSVLADSIAISLKGNKYLTGMGSLFENTFNGIFSGLDRLGEQFAKGIADTIDVSKYQAKANQEKYSNTTEAGRSARDRYDSNKSSNTKDTTSKQFGSMIKDSLFGPKSKGQDVRVTNFRDAIVELLNTDLYSYIINTDDIINEEMITNSINASKSDESDNTRDELSKDDEMIIETINELEDRLANASSLDDKGEIFDNMHTVLSQLSNGGFGNVSDSVMTDSISRLTSMLGSNDASDAAAAFRNAPLQSAADLDGIGGIISDAFGGLGDILSSALGPIFGPIIGAFAGLAAVIGPVAILMELLKPILESLMALFSAMGDAANREEESRKKRQEYAQQRLKADIKAMVEAPFNILKDAANELYGTWKESIDNINATQGYTKEDLQNFMSTMAQRIEAEGYGNVISIADLTKDIGKVLDKGLTGKIGEEFAWVASKLNAAMPTQDFFSYAESYASLVANAQSAGMSQAAAIEKANEALEQMASSLMYAGREISDGITIGLQSGADLFNEAVKITQAGRQTDNETLSKVAGTLTSASAIIGAVAPDLSKSIVDAITSAATGGNNETIVALRSLSNQNASNTEFLKKFIENPQKIFSEIFVNLSDIFNESEDAYMEKAEAYANLFGMSAEAFQRIDFEQLAVAITTMTVSNTKALDQTNELILAGQTKTTDEQMKIAQINKYMQEEGLAYVIDNEVAQMIQQHMWDEQLAREMQETTYGVELVGKTFSLLDAIVGFVERLVNLLNPFYWAKKVANIFQSAQETKAWEDDISDMLEAVKVGQGNAYDKYMLTHRNETYGLIGENKDNKYLSVLKDAGIANKTSNVASVAQGYHDTFKNITFSIDNILQAMRDNTRATLSNTDASGKNSKSLYRWHLVTKKDAQAASDAIRKGAAESAKAMSDAFSSYDSAVKKLQEDNRKWLEDFEKEYVDPKTTKDGLGSFFNGIFGRLSDAMRKFFETDIPTSAKRAAAEVKSTTRQSFTDFYEELTKGMTLEQRHAMSTIWVKDDDEKDKNNDSKYDIYKNNTLMQFAKDSTKTFEDWEAEMFKRQKWALDDGRDVKSASDYELAEAFERIVSERGANLEQWREYFEAERQNAEVDKKRLIEQEENMERQAAIYFYESTEADLGEMIELFIENNSILTTIATLVDNVRGLFAEYKMKWQTYYLGSTESKVGTTSVVKDLLVSTKTNSGGLAQIKIDDVNSKLAEQYKQLEDAEKGITGFTYYEKRLNSGLASGKTYYDKVKEVQDKEKGEKDDAVLALAEALTANTVDLRDPQVQGNALLAEILKLVAALVNQNNTTVTNTALPSDIASLATNAANAVSTATSVVGAVTGVNVPPIT